MSPVESGDRSLLFFIVLRSPGCRHDMRPRTATDCASSAAPLEAIAPTVAVAVTTTVAALVATTAALGVADTETTAMVMPLDGGQREK